MIAVVGGEKGGVGKTTLALTLAAYLAAFGRRVLLVDSDTRFNALAWLAERPAILPAIAGAFEPQRLLPRPPGAYEDMVVDAGAGDSEVLRDAMRVADLMISPFTPSQLDVWKAPPVLERIIEARQTNPKLVVVAVVNDVDPRQGGPEIGEEARQALASAGGATWHVARQMVFTRRAWPRCSGNGHAVHEVGRSGYQAAEDFAALLAEIAGLAPDRFPLFTSEEVPA